MRKFIKFKFLILAFLAYFTANGLWRNVTEGILKSVAPEAYYPRTKLTAEQAAHFDYLLNVAREVSEALFALYILAVFMCLVGAALFLANRRNLESRFVSFVTANGIALRRSIIIAILLFFAATITTTVYPLIYPLKIQNSGFLTELHTLREDGDGNSKVGK